MSPAEFKKLAPEIERFLDRWAPRRLYSASDRTECLWHLISIIDMAHPDPVEPVVEIPHEGRVD